MPFTADVLPVFYVQEDPGPLLPITEETLALAESRPTPVDFYQRIFWLWNNPDYAVGGNDAG